MRDLPAPIVVRKSILASNLCSTTFSGFGKGCTALVDVFKYINLFFNYSGYLCRFGIYTLYGGQNAFEYA